MKLQELFQLTERLTYHRKGYTFESSMMHDIFHFNVSVGCPSSEVPQPSEEKDLRVRFVIGMNYIECWDFSDALRWILSCMRWVDMHEIYEWLRLDGQVLIEPHPEVHGSPGRSILGEVQEPHA